MSLVLAHGFDLGDAISLTLQYPTSLKFSDGPDHDDEQPPGGNGGVQIQLNDLQVGITVGWKRINSPRT